MPIQLTRVASLLVSTSLMTLLVIRGGAAGCASQHTPPDPSLAQVSTSPVPTAPAPSAAEATPPVAPHPVLDVPPYFPATKAGPVFYTPPPSRP